MEFHTQLCPEICHSRDRFHTDMAVCTVHIQGQPSSTLLQIYFNVRFSLVKTNFLNIYDGYSAYYPHIYKG